MHLRPELQLGAGERLEVVVIVVVLPIKVVVLGAEVVCAEVPVELDVS